MSETPDASLNDDEITSSAGGTAERGFTVPGKIFSQARRMGSLESQA